MLSYARTLSNGRRPLWVERAILVDMAGTLVVSDGLVDSGDGAGDGSSALLERPSWRKGLVAGTPGPRARSCAAPGLT